MKEPRVKDAACGEKGDVTGRRKLWSKGPTVGVGLASMRNLEEA